MSLLARTVWLTMLFLSAAFAAAAEAREAAKPQVNVLVDPSLSLPLARIARDYAAHKGTAISISSAPSTEQMMRIEQGQEADIFITTRADTVRSLKTQGLIDVYSHAPIAKNRLAMVTYTDNRLEVALMPRLPLATIMEQVDPGFSFALGDPDYQDSGLYALEALRSFDLASDLEPSFLFIGSLQEQVQTIAAKGGYGIMFQSDALRHPELKILAVFPEHSHSPILYRAMAVASEHMQTASNFLRYLSSPEAAARFTAYGFEPAGSDDEPNGHLARGSTDKSLTNPL